LEKSNSASLIPKLRFTEDLRQHNFKQEEFLKEVRLHHHRRHLASKGIAQELTTLFPPKALGEKPQKFPQLVVPAGGKTLSDIGTYRTRTTPPIAMLTHPN
jgi:hypothetical protein